MIKTTTIALVAILAFATCMIYTKLHTATPDEWMLVIEDGEMLLAGVGMRHFARPGQQVVTFPSSLQKVSFTAQQVTREMQGIEVQGFAIWGVYREQDGPYKAYKSLEGLSDSGQKKANMNLANMAESILRAQVANMTIAEVLTQRKGMRKELTQEMMEVVKGWGIWLETVEVTDVKVLSDSLFKNLQTKFREETRQKAEQFQLEVQRKIDLTRVQHDLLVAKSTAAANREREVHKLQQHVAEQEEKAAAEARQHTLQLERQAREHKQAMQSEKQASDLRAAKLSEDLKQRLLQAQTDAKIEELRIKTERMMTAVNIDNAKMRTMKEIYAALPLKEFKVVNVAAAGDANSTGLLLPGLAAALMH